MNNFIWGSEALNEGGKITTRRIRQCLALMLCCIIFGTLVSVQYAYRVDAGYAGVVPTGMLKKGSVGDEVTSVQVRLSSLGYFAEEPDGSFGISTETAVMDFQRAVGITVDGVVGSLTVARLYDDSAPRKAGTGYELLLRGSTGPAVIGLQKKLIELGLLNVEANGIYGPQTEGAVRRFQQSCGLPATGTATPETQEKLYDAMTTGSTGERGLKSGDSGAAVKTLQERLTELGYLAAVATGVYAAPTRAAVEEFQKTSKITATGEADPATLGKLYSTSAVPKAVTSVLKRGSTGDAVKKLQQYLVKLDYLQAVPNGNFGASTEAAVIAYHRSVGMIPDGIAGPVTQSKLYAYDLTASDYQTLTKTSSGSAVIRLQERLKGLRYFAGECNGTYTDLTEAAVISFQRELGLPETGIADADLQRRLFDNNAPDAKNVLMRGDSGDEVRRLQASLIEQGYLSSSVTGNFLAMTEAAVIAFQQAKRITPVDGRATQAVRDALYQLSEETPQKPNLTRELKKGCEGEDVRTVQKRLADLGYYTFGIDGSFGTETDYSVRDFQLSAKLEIDGKIGSQTLDKMYSADAPKRPPSLGKTTKITILRRSASSSGEEVKVLPANTQVNVISVANGWCQVQLVNASGEGYISAADVNVLVRAVLMNNSSVTVSSSYTLAVRVNDTYAANKGIKWSSSNSEIAAVSSSGVVTAVKSGTVTIRAEATDGSGAYGECKVTSTAATVSNPGSSSESTDSSAFTVKFNRYSVSIPAGKSIFNKAIFSPSTSKSLVTWSSDNTQIATFKDGHVAGVSPGTTTVRVKDSRNGTLKATITVTVTEAEPVLSGYASPNIAKPGSTVTLTAVTDNTRDKVKFTVTEASGTSKSYETTSYTTSGSKRIWKASAVISGSGMSSVTATSRKNGTMSSTGFAFKAYTSSVAGSTTPVTGERLVSDGLLQFVAESEGWSATTYGDMVGNPTIGYGYAIFDGFTYYDNLTREEGWALLVTLTNGSYTTQMNNFVKNNGLKMTQGQFDALVSLGFNIGAGFVNSPSSYSLVNSILNAPNKDATQVSKNSIISGFTGIHHITVDGKKQDVAGLLYRRFEEVEMFLEGDYGRNFDDWKPGGKKYNKYPYPDGFQNGKLH